LAKSGGHDTGPRQKVGRRHSSQKLKLGRTNQKVGRGKAWSVRGTGSKMKKKGTNWTYAKQKEGTGEEGVRKVANLQRHGGTRGRMLTRPGEKKSGHAELGERRT